jgi:peptidyl-prolyl cis-trans isomerase A (cyclophilin A)
MTIRIRLSLVCSVVLPLALLLAGCSRQPEVAEEVKAPETKAEPAKPATAETFKVRFETTKGNFIVEANRKWAPIGVERFEQLVKAGFFDNSAFFRVVPNFVIQFGLAADPKMTAKYRYEIDDDPVIRTNRYGSLSFATRGPNTRTTQLFINLRSNQNLDGQGFAPFAQVIEGMEVVEKLNPEYGERPDQQQLERRGNAYLQANFPRLDYIKRAVIVEEPTATE